jgi:hypothetical protein
MKNEEVKVVERRAGSIIAKHTNKADAQYLFTYLLVKLGYAVLSTILESSHFCWVSMV